MVKKWNVVKGKVISKISLFIIGAMILSSYVGVPISTAIAEWGNINVYTDSKGWPAVKLGNSKILVRYRHFNEGYDEHVIRDFKIKDVDEDLVVGGFLDAAAGRGPLTNAIIVEDEADIKTVRLEWDNGSHVSEVSIFPGSNYIKIDYIKYGINIVDIGFVDGSLGKYRIHGAAKWKRGYVLHPQVYFDRYLGDVGSFGITEIDETGPLDYHGYLILGVFNVTNGRGYGRVMPIAQTDIIKLLWKRGFEFFTCYNRKKEPFTGYIFAVNGGGAAEIISTGKSLIDSIGGLKGDWKFDEASGNVVVDSSGNGNDGEIKGTTLRVPGKKGGGILLDGVNDFAKVPKADSREVTVSSWFYKNANDATEKDVIIGSLKHNADVRLREGYELRFAKSNPDLVQFVLESGDQAGNVIQKVVQKDIGSSVGTWFHVAGSYDKPTGVQKLYINGQKVGSKSHPKGNALVPLTSLNNMRIGQSRIGNGGFDGVIDEVRYYNEAVNDQIVQYLYASIVGLEGYWRFEEGKQSTTTDSSGNGNYGRINASATWTTGKVGGGLGFNGIDNYVSVPVMNNEEISIAAWFYKDSIDTTYADSLFGAYKEDVNIQNREGFALLFPNSSPDELQFLLVTEDGSGNKTERIARKEMGASVGSWFHVVGTYNKTTGKQKLYIDGQRVNTKSHPAGNTIVPLTAHSDMRIGHSRYGDGYFAGTIDDVRLYKTGLNAQEVLDMYKSL